MPKRNISTIAALMLSVTAVCTCPAFAQTSTSRRIAVDVGSQSKPRDRMAQLSVGSDFLER